ncbi:unnamed protein product [Leptosia nina]|uniref:SRA1/Sec31 domain-containing protein n=1 Tax=Leptosia nina TaxID=320188 RepID=A0AAV1JJM6_9NEOP
MDNVQNIQDTNSKVTFDPGWNDPPTFSYNAQQTTTPNKPRLNKRVAFPLSNNVSTAPPVPVNMPPMPVLLPTRTTAISTQKTDSEEDIQIDSEQMLYEVREVLLDILNDSTELGAKGDSIKKKISTMEEMWSNGKINKQVQMKMQELGKALKEDNPSKADELHKALMVDHVSTVGTWMPGIKQLIYHCKARTELLAIDKE